MFKEKEREASVRCPGFEPHRPLRHNVAEVAVKPAAQTVIHVLGGLARTLKLPLPIPSQVLQHLEVEIVNQAAIGTPHVNGDAIGLAEADRRLHTLAMGHAQYRS